ncbi:morphogenic membrane protein MmpB [Streptomyces sp. NPDC050585]
MLWSDPENEPPEEMRVMQAMLRRAGTLLALAMLISILTTTLR